MFGLGAPEIGILALVILVLFGGSKVPQLMRGLGEGMREFKKATREDDDDAKRPAGELPPSSTTRS
jgi:sec-independent protein translocase protein TatA